MGRLLPDRSAHHTGAGAAPASADPDEIGRAARRGASPVRDDARRAPGPHAGRGSSSAPGEATDAEAPRAPPVGLLLLVTAVVGIGVSFASWGYLEVIHPVQGGASEKLPEALGYDNGAPTWWPLPMLAVAGLLTAAAITALPGDGGHRPVDGLKTGSTPPAALPRGRLAPRATT